jgi:hypothetical protein
MHQNLIPGECTYAIAIRSSQGNAAIRPSLMSAPFMYRKRSATMQLRQRFQPSIPFNDPASSLIQGMRDRAYVMSPGPERDKLLRKIEKAEAAAETEGWANSREL